MSDKIYDNKIRDSDNLATNTKKQDIYIQTSEKLNISGIGDTFNFLNRTVYFYCIFIANVETFLKIGMIKSSFIKKNFIKK